MAMPATATMARKVILKAGLEESSGATRDGGQGERGGAEGVEQGSAARGAGGR